MFSKSTAVAVSPELDFVHTFVNRAVPKRTKETNHISWKL